MILPGPVNRAPNLSAGGAGDPFKRGTGRVARPMEGMVMTDGGPDHVTPMASIAARHGRGADGRNHCGSWPYWQPAALLLLGCLQPLTPCTAWLRAQPLSAGLRMRLALRALDMNGAGFGFRPVPPQAEQEGGGSSFS